MIGPTYTASVERAGDITFLVIEDRNEGMSVTNSIDVVLAEQVKAGNLRPGYRVIYRDTERIWDEVIVDGACKSIGFFSLHASNLFDAMRLSLTKRAPSPIEEPLNVLPKPAFISEPNDDDLPRMGYERPFRIMHGEPAALMQTNPWLFAIVAGTHPWGIVMPTTT